MHKYIERKACMLGKKDETQNLDQVVKSIKDE